VPHETRSHSRRTNLFLSRAFSRTGLRRNPRRQHGVRFRPAGEIVKAPIERQTEIVMEQMKRCLEAAGASLDSVMKCNIFCTSAKYFAAVNAVYDRYFPVNPPARIFVPIPEWTGPFDIEIDCIAMV
jgi:enamine deaminase RidA (YjgF/YER057c/UK114 family)